MPKNKIVIGVATSFYNFDSGYSLCAVVRDQLTVLVKNGYKTILFVLPTFKDDVLVPQGVEIRKIVPQLILEPYKEFGFPDHWKEDVKKVRESFELNMQDITHLIVHDWGFIDTFIPYWTALREIIDRLSNLKQIFSWVHSAPSTRPVLENNIHANRFTLPPKTKIIYLNHYQTNDIAEMMGAWLKDVRVVHNSRDPRTFWDLHPLVNSAVDKYSLLDKDIISTYALSTTRMITGKGVDKFIKLHSKLKTLGYKTALIICNAHANADKEKKTINQTQMFAYDRGLDQTDLIFTSLEGKEYEMGVPPKVVSDFFRLSNVFTFPTISENCSLVLLEAMLSGNLLVLNKNVQSLREFGGDNALYFDFNYRDNQEENERYYLDLAKILASQFEQQKTLQVKREVMKNYNYQSIFKRQTEPLLYETWEN